MSEKKQTVRKLAILLALYFAQGLPFGFQANALPLYLREFGVSLTTISLAGALGAPWMFKVLWAPLIDRYWSPRWGRRRSWILPLQLALTVCCGATMLCDPATEPVQLMVMVFLMNLFAASQDIAVDGLAVDWLDKNELGPGNAAQVVGYKAGMLTSGGLLVYAAAHVGWPGFFGIMTGLLALVFVVMLFVREDEVSEPARDIKPTRVVEIYKTLLELCKSRRAVWLLAVVASYKFGESMTDGMFKLYLVDSGLPTAMVGLWVGSYGMVASVLGSLAGGWIAYRMDLWRALALTSTLRVIPLAAIWLLSLSGSLDPFTVIAVTCGEHFFGGALTTAMFAFMMSRTDSRIGATHYTLLATVEVFGKSPGYLASGWLVGQITYSGVFLIGFVLSALYLLLLKPLRETGELSESHTP